MSYELIETVEVGAGGAASIEFTSIPQDGTDLVVKYSLRNSGGSEAFFASFNGTTGQNYPQMYLRGSGSTVLTTSRNDNGFYFTWSNISSNTANTFSNVEIYISNYTSTNDISWSIDSVVENNSSTGDFRHIHAGKYTGGLPITSVKLGPPQSSATFDQYSTASLYKITAA